MWHTALNDIHAPVAMTGMFVQVHAVHTTQTGRCQLVILWLVLPSNKEGAQQQGGCRDWSEPRNAVDGQVDTCM